MNLILLGPPGSGKGTQAKLLAEKLSVPHISTGDIFRQNIKNQTELGLQVKSILDAGELVPNEVTDELVKNRLAEADCVNGFILDGYPRNLHQCEQLDIMTKLDKAINVIVSDEEVTKRLSSRRSCPKCKKIYNLLFNPPAVEGKCECGSDLILRDDDTPEVIANRLKVYHEQAEPILNYYKEKGNLVDVNGEIGKENVFAEILEKIKLS
jgi:adenylate kinase